MSRPGDLDTTFGTGGKVTTDFSNAGDYGYSVAIQTDGKIILGGFARLGTNRNFALARYNSNGSLDSTFGTDGKVTTDFANGTDQGYSVAIQTDGKIILGGYVNPGPNFGLARYNSNGSLDTTFGIGGKVTTDFANGTDEGYSVAIQTDGKIILGGTVYPGPNFGLARYNSDGTLDSTFGTGGKVTTDFANSTDKGYSVSIQTDGKIILGGSALGGSAVISGSTNFALARYNSDGSLDSTFGTGGKVNTDFNNSSDEGRSVALQTDGKIILGGTVYPGPDFGLARYNSNGSLDTTFGVGGKVTTDFANASDYGYSVAIQTDGKIILGGSANIGGTAKFALARYHENGSLDTTFGTGGKVTSNFTGFSYQVAIQTDSKIILGGDDISNFTLTRYINNTFIPSKPISYYINLNYTLQQIKDLNQYDASYFKAAGYTITQLKAINFTDAELKSGGYLISDFKAAGYTDAEIKALEFLAAEFKVAGYTITQLKAINFTDDELKTAGYSVADFKSAGYTIPQLKAISFTDAQIKAGGYLISDFKTAGYTDAELKTAGYSVAEFKAAGYTNVQLNSIGFTNAEIKLLYIISESTEQLVFIDAGSTLLADNVDDQGYTINVANKNYKYFNLPTNSYVSYNNLGIGTNGLIMFDNTSSSSSLSNQDPINSLRFFSFDARSTIKYYFDTNDNLMISTTGAYFNNINDTPFIIIIKIEPNGKITINYKSIGTGTYTPIIGWVGTNSSLTTDDVFYSTFNGIQAFNANNINGKTLVFNFTNLIKFPIIPIIPICFPAGTPVLTDQGTVPIQKINPSTNTIRGKNIVAVTKTITIEDNIVCIEKDSLGTNIPSQKTYISRNHELLYNKQMIKAKNLVGKVEGVYNKKYNGEILYNVLLDKHDKMIVNNLIVETLDPENIVAKLYDGSFKTEERNNIIIILNNGAKEYKKQFGKMR
jgi:uncharacterized delta-60 repeat protein